MEARRRQHRRVDGRAAGEVLDRAGVRRGAREVVFRGADGGMVDGRAEPIRFERSLTLDEAGIPTCCSRTR